MIENKLILLLRRSKSLTPKSSESKFCKWKAYSTPSTESQSSFYYSRIIPSVKTSITGSFIGCGLRSLLQNNVKNFHIRSFRNFSTSTSANAKGTEGLKLLVTAGSNAQEVVGIWLFVSAAWVYSMVVLGGVTRLAKSGLPMTDWKFTGRLPFSNDDWLAEFEKYKQSHEYKRVNKEMTIDDFRLMYYMEYAHVLWGRSLAVMFGVPFSYFLLKGYITLRLGLRLSGLFALCAGQGLIGRWTAKCSEEPKSEFAGPRVSFYHLAAHSVSTFAVYSGLFWTALSVAMPESPAESIAWVQQAAKVKRFVLPVSFIVGITAISGAFVAESGGAFSASSRTSEGWVSDDVFVLKTQLVHQVLAAASLLAIGGLWWSTRTPDIPPALRPLIGSTIGIAAVQVSLGTAPLLSTAPPSLSTLHQAGVLTLLTLAIYLNHIVRRPSPQLLKTLSSLRRHEKIPYNCCQYIRPQRRPPPLLQAKMRSKQRLFLLLVLMPLLFLFIHQLGGVEKTVAHAGSVGGGSPVVSGGSHVPSGGGVTPVYAAAGAGNNHHPHRGGGNCDRGGAAPEALAVITFACFLFCFKQCF